MNSCPICNNKTKLKFVKSKIDLKQCTSCKFVFVDPLPSIETQEKYYEESHTKGLYRIHSDDDKILREKLNHYRFNEISKYSHDGKVLDVGCAAGFFLDQAKKSGLSCFGVELSNEAAQKAKKNHNNIFVGKLEDAKYENLFFDIVTMYDIIEHVTDINSTIREIHRITKPNGLIVISTPDISSWHAKVMGKNWGMITPFEHLYYFSKENMKSFLIKHGFEILEIRKNFKIFTLDYLFKMAEYYFPHLFKILPYLSLLIPKSILSKERLFYFGELLVVAKKL